MALNIKNVSRSYMARCGFYLCSAYKMLVIKCTHVEYLTYDSLLSPKNKSILNDGLNFLQKNHPFIGEVESKQDI